MWSSFGRAFDSDGGVAGTAWNMRVSMHVQGELLELELPLHSSPR